MRLAGWLAVILWLRPVLASAQQVPEERAFSVMNLLVPSDPQDVGEERWNAYGQSTFIVQGKGGFPAAYTNANGSTQSLVPQAEASFTYSLTLFLGLRPWPGAEAFLVPEVIAETPLSGLKGLGASVQNFELQKTGGPVPSLYRSRTFLRQTIDFGGHPHEWTSGPMQLATVASDRRLVLTGGTFSILDVFDRSDVIGDLRRTFFNMAFMTHASWDFTCDARGFSLGAAAQFYWDDWALRIGRMAAPLTPDQLPLDPRSPPELWRHTGARARSCLVRTGRHGAAPGLPKPRGDGAVRGRDRRVRRRSYEERGGLPVERVQLWLDERNGAGPLLGPQAQHEAGRRDPSRAIVGRWGWGLSSRHVLRW